MKTHIVILIKDIENIDKRFTKDAPLSYIKSELLKLGKQISLDEKDTNFLEKQANKYYKEADDSVIGGFCDGYEQALKDFK